jgi:hypothetical protein
MRQTWFRQRGGSCAVSGVAIAERRTFGGEPDSDSTVEGVDEDLGNLDVGEYHGGRVRGSAGPFTDLRPLHTTTNQKPPSALPFTSMLECCELLVPFHVGRFRLKGMKWPLAAIMFLIVHYLSWRARNWGFRARVRQGDYTSMWIALLKPRSSQNP